MKLKAVIGSQIDWATADNRDHCLAEGCGLISFQSPPLLKHAHAIYRNFFGCKKSKISLEKFSCFYFLFLLNNIDYFSIQ